MGPEYQTWCIHKLIYAWRCFRLVTDGLCLFAKILDLPGPLTDSDEDCYLFVSNTSFNNSKLLSKAALAYSVEYQVPKAARHTGVSSGLKLPDAARYSNTQQVTWYGELNNSTIRVKKEVSSRTGLPPSRAPNCPPVY